jgi:hypothetical protein
VKLCNLFAETLGEFFAVNANFSVLTVFEKSTEVAFGGWQDSQV